MENLEQPKPEQKGKSISTIIFGSPEERAIVSFVLGCINVIFPAAIMLTVGSVYSVYRGDDIAGALLILLSPIIGLLSALLGLILGIMGLKSTKRNFAIAGIVLSIVSLFIIVSVGWFVFYSTMGQPIDQINQILTIARSILIR